MTIVGRVRDLYGEAQRHFAHVQYQKFVYRPSFPVLFFGDLESYLSSTVRVVTVGLNPSWKEFDGDLCLCKAARSRNTDHFEALTKYFKHDDHYRSWFNGK